MVSHTEIPGTSDEIELVRTKGKYVIVPRNFEGEIVEQER